MRVNRYKPSALLLYTRDKTFLVRSTEFRSLILVVVVFSVSYHYSFSFRFFSECSLRVSLLWALLSVSSHTRNSTLSIFGMSVVLFEVSCSVYACRMSMRFPAPCTHIVIILALMRNSDVSTMATLWIRRNFIKIPRTPYRSWISLLACNCDYLFRALFQCYVPFMHYLRGNTVNDSMSCLFVGFKVISFLTERLFVSLREILARLDVYGRFQNGEVLIRLCSIVLNYSVSVDCDSTIDRILVILVVKLE